MRITVKHLRSACCLLAAIGVAGCSKDPAMDPNAPIVVEKSAGPSPVKGTTVQPQTAATGGEIDVNQQRAIEMETRSSQEAQANAPTGNR